MKNEIIKNKIIGNWIVKDGKVIADANCLQIENMIKSELKEINKRDDGWTRLYKNEKTKQYWELTYPQSEMHGGGPPALEQIDEKDIKDKYK